MFLNVLFNLVYTYGTQEGNKCEFSIIIFRQSFCFSCKKGLKELSVTPQIGFLS